MAPDTRPAPGQGTKTGTGPGGVRYEDRKYENVPKELPEESSRLEVELGHGSQHGKD